MPTIRKPYERERQPKTFEGPSLAKQAMKAECDINNIMKKFEKTGLLTHVNQHRGDYSELPSELDYQAAMNSVLAAADAFRTLPSKLRKRFDNDPEQFLRFVQDPANKEELRELGLAKPLPAEQIPAAEPPPGSEPPEGA